MKESYIQVHISNLEKLRDEHGENDAIYETLTDVLNMLSLPLSNEDNLLYDRYIAKRNKREPVEILETLEQTRDAYMSLANDISKYEKWTEEGINLVKETIDTDIKKIEKFIKGVI